MEERAEKAAQKGSKTERWCWRLILLVTVSLVATMAALTLLKYFKHSNSSRVSGRPGPVVQKYSEALQLSMQFFDIQKCKQTQFSNSCFDLIFLVIITMHVVDVVDFFVVVCSW